MFTVIDAAGNRTVYRTLISAGRAFLALPVNARGSVSDAKGNNVTTLARMEALL